jgi:hypothetical protein
VNTTPWHIVEQRLLDTAALVGGVGRRARATHCTTCRTPVITGLDADLAALDATTDPTPLSPLGEALAHIANRRTYALQTEGGRLVLNPRDASRITHRPAGTHRFDVMPEHRCHDQTHLPTIPSRLTHLAALDLTAGAPAPF